MLFKDNPDVGFLPLLSIILGAVLVAVSAVFNIGCLVETIDCGLFSTGVFVVCSTFFTGIGVIPTRLK